MPVVLNILIYILVTHIYPTAWCLQAELPAEERRLWTLLADASVLDWYPYGYTVFAGVRRLLFRQEGSITAEGHFFKYHPPANNTSVLGLKAGLGQAAAAEAGAGDVCSRDVSGSRDQSTMGKAGRDCTLSPGLSPMTAEIRAAAA